MTSKLINKYTDKETPNEANYTGNGNQRRKQFTSAPVAAMGTIKATDTGGGVEEREPCTTLVGT